MSKVEDKSTATENNNGLSQERNAESRIRFWKVSSYLQLIGIVTLIITLAVTMEASVSYQLIFSLLTCLFLQKTKLKHYENKIEPKFEIGFSRKILAFGRTTENDFARALLIDPDGKFDAIKLKNLEVSPEVTISMLENIITYKGQLIVYQTMTGISRHSTKNIIKLIISIIIYDS